MLINVHFDPLFYWNCKSCQKSSPCRYLQYVNIFADPLNYLLSSFPRPICESLSSQNAKIWIRQLFKFCRPRIRQFLKGKFIPSGLCAVRGAGCEPCGEFVWQSSKPQGVTIHNAWLGRVWPETLQPSRGCDQTWSCKPLDRGQPCHLKPYSQPAQRSEFEMTTSILYCPAADKVDNNSVRIANILFPPSKANISVDRISILFAVRQNL